MTLRSRHLKVLQFGKEVTPGTAVAADKLAPDLRGNIFFAGDPSQEYMASGYIFPNGLSSRAEWGAGPWTLPFCFNQSTYVYDSLYHIATPSGAGTAKTRTWTHAVASAGTRQFYTFQRGQAGSRNQHAYGHFNSHSYTIQKRGEVQQSGDMFAREGVPGTALTATPTVVSSLIADNTQFIAQTATNWANLEAAPTTTTDIHNLAFQVGPMLSPAYFIGATLRSFDAVGIIVPNSTVTLVLPEDTSGSDLAGLLTLSAKRNGSPLYLRLKVAGPEVETGINALWQHDMVLKALNVPTEQDIEEPFAGVSWPCKLFVDTTAQKAHEIKIINNLAAT